MGAPLTLVLRRAQDCERAVDWIHNAAEGSIITITEPRRSVPQNALLHAMLSDIAEQKTWHGFKLSVEDWKDVFTAALNRDLRMVPNMAGDAMVLLGEHTSQMSVKTLTDLIELVSAWGAQNGVAFKTNREAA